MKKDEWGLPIVSQDEDPQLWKETNIVRTLIKQERSHGQWKKQGINFVALCLLITNQILRGRVFDRCSAGDWISLVVFVLCMTG